VITGSRSLHSVSVSTVDECTKAGANVIVSGSGVFKHDSPKEAIEIMRKSVQAHVLKKKDSK
jgi:pentose-5-phosphate-3-epimerase